MRFQNASIDSRPHYRFGAFTTVHTVKRSKTIERHVVTYRGKLNSLCMLQTDAFAIFQAIFPFIVFILMRFQPSSTVHIDMMYNRFRFDPLSRAFSNRWVFDEYAQRISVDGRRKRAEMYAFLNENELVWKDFWRKHSFFFLQKIRTYLRTLIA